MKRIGLALFVFHEHLYSSQGSGEDAVKKFGFPNLKGFDLHKLKLDELKFGGGFDPQKFNVDQLKSFGIPDLKDLNFFGSKVNLSNLKNSTKDQKDEGDNGGGGGTTPSACVEEDAAALIALQTFEVLGDFMNPDMNQNACAPDNYAYLFWENEGSMTVQAEDVEYVFKATGFQFSKDVSLACTEGLECPDCEIVEQDATSARFRCSNVTVPVEDILWPELNICWASDSLPSPNLLELSSGCDATADSAVSESSCSIAEGPFGSVAQEFSDCTSDACPSCTQGERYQATLTGFSSLAQTSVRFRFSPAALNDNNEPAIDTSSVTVVGCGDQTVSSSETLLRMDCPPETDTLTVCFDPMDFSLGFRGNPGWSVEETAQSEGFCAEANLRLCDSTDAEAQAVSITQCGLVAGDCDECPSGQEYKISFTDTFDSVFDILFQRQTSVGFSNAVMVDPDSGVSGSGGLCETAVSNTAQAGFVCDGSGLGGSPSTWSLCFDDSNDVAQVDIEFPIGEVEPQDGFCRQLFESVSLSVQGS
uniref:Uncharacterized protein n=1 Tax=Chromera velia CCMP2878 TaxID=1169474 RepID=A0A0G4F6P3_9ALVE|eukprot:Cvel_15407.t1-p1 / transcript=Cvel_15407.t1 / gene=Cvel_15407 / organism=Chromera_velia_CCMP2878 / gene_product=hypothetical protein / transcript_product=hypothetical protein / location=Cvel_scaffold1138:11064-15980(+) / protein_length=532 / sequence_SO=supercontig / SO=protein_coding / is_pseudo=false